MPLDLEEITIPDERFGEKRTEKDDEMEELMSSIDQYGILQPVILDENYRLIAGNRRVHAVVFLGRDHLEDHEYSIQSELNEAEKREVELIENMHRLDLSWAEEQEAIAQVHELKMEIEGDWDTEKTAQIIGKSRRSVQNALKIEQEAEHDPSVKEDNETLVGALRDIREKKELEERKKEVERKKQGRGKSLRAEIVQGDARELIQEVEDESFDAIVTNPPFGVDLDLKGDGSGEVYHDDEDYITDLVIEMCHEWYRTLKDDSWLVCFFDVNKITTNKYQRKLYQELRDHDDLGDLRTDLVRSLGLVGWLEEAGFDYIQPTPAMWVKPNKTQGLVGDVKKGLISAYEAFVFAGKGDPRLLEKGGQNIFIYDTPTSSDRVHPLQMNTDFTEQLCRMTVLGGELVHDSFAGSGSIGLGALSRQAEFLGFELNEEYAENGQMMLDEHLYSEGSSD